MPLNLPDPQLPGNPQDALQSIQRNFEALATSLVGANEIADGAITGEKIAASTTDTATTASGISGSFTVRKYADSLVLISGSVNRATALANGELLATLPVGYRPASNITGVGFVFDGGNPGVARIQINTSGQVSRLEATVNPTIVTASFAFHAA